MKISVYVEKERALEAGYNDYGYQVVSVDAARLSGVAFVLENLHREMSGMRVKEADYDLGKARHLSYFGAHPPAFLAGRATPETITEWLENVNTWMHNLQDKMCGRITYDPDQFIEAASNGAVTICKNVRRDAPDDYKKILEDRRDYHQEKVVKRAIEQVQDMDDDEILDQFVDTMHYFPEHHNHLSLQGKVYVDYEPLDEKFRVDLDDLPEELQDRIRAVRDEYKERADRRHEKKKERERQARREYEQEREEWIRENGSRRLRRMLEEGIELDAVYRDERLQQERPGWRWRENVRGEEHSPRNVPEEAIDLLDEARQTAPDATLAYWTVEPETQEEHYIASEDDSKYLWEGYVAVDQFMGEDIIFGENLPEK